MIFKTLYTGKAQFAKPRDLANTIRPNKNRSANKTAKCHVAITPDRMRQRLKMEVPSEMCLKVTR